MTLLNCLHFLLFILDPFIQTTNNLNAYEKESSRKCTGVAIILLFTILSKFKLAKLSAIYLLVFEEERLRWGKLCEAKLG